VNPLLLGQAFICRSIKSLQKLAEAHDVNQFVGNDVQCESQQRQAGVLPEPDRMAWS